jgi:hypothetical protein
MGVLVICILYLTEVFLTLTEVFPCFFLTCKANSRVKLAKTGHGPHSSSLVVMCCSVYCLCVNVYCHRVTTQLQLTNISYQLSYRIISYIIIDASSGLPKNRSNVSNFLVHSGIPNAYNRWYSWYSSVHVSEIWIYIMEYILKFKMVKVTQKHLCLVTVKYVWLLFGSKRLSLRDIIMWKEWLSN